MALRGHFSCITGALARPVRRQGRAACSPESTRPNPQEQHAREANGQLRWLTPLSCRPSEPTTQGHKDAGQTGCTDPQTKTSTRCFGVASIPAVARLDDYLGRVQMTARCCGEPENHCQVVVSRKRTTRRTPHLVISANGGACAVHRAPKAHRVHGADGPAASSSPGRQNAQ